MKGDYSPRWQTTNIRQPVYSNGDGVTASDNCVSVPNPDQGDGDLDGFGDSCDIDQLQSTIQELNNLVIQLSQQNETLQSKIKNLEDACDGIDQKILGLKSDVSDLKAADSEFQQEIDNLDGMVRNHSHVYMTGSGKGHNSEEADTGLPDF